MDFLNGGKTTIDMSAIGFYRKKCVLNTVIIMLVERLKWLLSRPHLKTSLKLNCVVCVY